MIGQENVYTKLRAIIQLGHLVRASFWNVPIRQRSWHTYWWKLPHDTSWDCALKLQHLSGTGKYYRTISASTFHAFVNSTSSVRFHCYYWWTIFMTISFCIITRNKRMLGIPSFKTETLMSSPKPLGGIR